MLYKHYSIHTPPLPQINYMDFLFIFPERKVLLILGLLGGAKDTIFSFLIAESSFIKL